MAVSAVIGSTLAVPRTPSVPNSLRVMDAYLRPAEWQRHPLPSNGLGSEPDHAPGSGSGPAPKPRLALDARGRHRGPAAAVARLVGGSVVVAAARGRWSRRAAMRRSRRRTVSHTPAGPGPAHAVRRYARSRCLRARVSASSTIRRISSSIVLAVASETFLCVCNRMAEEHFLVILAVVQRPELFAHAQFGDHAPRDVGRHLDV